MSDHESSDDDFDFDNYDAGEYANGVGYNDDAEDSAFPDFEPVKEDPKEKEAKFEKSLIKALIKRPPEEWLAFLIIAKSTSTRKEYEKEYYNVPLAELIKKDWSWAEPCVVVFGSPMSRICKAVSTMTSNCVFTNDGGKAYSAMQGDAEFRNGLWVVDHVNPRRNVIPIKAQHAVDLQLMCASVSLENEVKTGMIDSRIQNQNFGKFVQRNIPPEEDRTRIIPGEVKALFPCLITDFRGAPKRRKDGSIVKNAKGEPELNPITPDELEERSFIWKRVWNNTNQLVIPTANIPLELAYFVFVKADFKYRPSPCKWEDVLYKPYPCIDKDLLSQLAHHSHWHGGVWLNRFHYLNEAMCLVERPYRLIGGEVPLDWVSYNTRTGVTWERAKAGIESNENLLETRTALVRPLEMFDGIFYDPVRLPVDKCLHLRGVIIPYDGAKNGLKWLESWKVKHMEANPKYVYRTWVSFGPSPCLWIYGKDPSDGVTDFAKDPTRPSGLSVNSNVAYEQDMVGFGAINTVLCGFFWKCMPTMILYNFIASLNQNWALSKVKGNKNKLARTIKSMEEQFYPTEPIWGMLHKPEKPELPFEFEIPVHKRIIKKQLLVPYVKPYFFPLDYLPGRWFVKQTNPDGVKKYDEAVDRWADLANLLHLADSGFTPSRKASKFEEDDDASSNSNKDAGQAKESHDADGDSNMSGTAC